MAYTRLSVTEREEISRSLAEDPTMTWTKLGERIGRHRSTVQREVDRNGGRHHYRASRAGERSTLGTVSTTKVVHRRGVGRQGPISSGGGLLAGSDSAPAR